MNNMGISIRTTIFLVLFAITSSSLAGAVLERKILSDGSNINCSKLMWIKMFLTPRSNKLFILPYPYPLYTLKGPVTAKNNPGVYVGGCVKDDRLVLAFWNIDNKVVFYDAGKGFQPIMSISMSRHDFKGIIPDAEKNDKFYIAYWDNVSPSDPLEIMKNIMSGGHGIVCAKPYLTEVMGDKVLRDYQVDYKGRRNESYLVEMAIGGGKLIHFLGIRYDPRIQATWKNPQPMMLYYAGYDPHKGKVLQVHDIMEKKSVPSSITYGPMSMAARNDDVFVAFSRYVASQGGNPLINKEITSDIYYFQYTGGAAGKTLQIGKGFLPLVKLDARGNVYVFWLDLEGNLFCKEKAGDAWGNEFVVLTGIDVLPGILYARYVAAEFDSKDNLHLVYPSQGKLMYEKRRLGEK
jgi:hypothetical protein